MIQNIPNEVKSLGSNTIYIDKWDYSGGPDQPIWKFRARPVAKYEEAEMIKKRGVLLDDISFLMLLPLCIKKEISSSSTPRFFIISASSYFATGLALNFQMG